MQNCFLFFVSMHLSLMLLAFDQTDINNATAGDTLLVDCAGSPHIQSADLVINKSLTLVGEANCPDKPIIRFTDVCHETRIEADNIVIDNIQFEKTQNGGCNVDLAGDNLIILMPSTFVNMGESIVPYKDFTLQNSCLIGGRRGVRLSVGDNGFARVLDNEFDGQIRSSIFIANQRGGTVTITGNNFKNWGRKAVLHEPITPSDVIWGANNIANNQGDMGVNFYVFNGWNTYNRTVSLSVNNNNIKNLSSNAIAFFMVNQSDFSIFQNIEILNNDIEDAGRGIIIDYCFGGALAAPKQIKVENNVLCGFSSSDLFLPVPITNSQKIGQSDNRALGIKVGGCGEGPPPGLNTNVFALVSGANTLVDLDEKNFGCEGRPDQEEEKLNQGDDDDGGSGAKNASNFCEKNFLHPVCIVPQSNRFEKERSSEHQEKTANSLARENFPENENSKIKTETMQEEPNEKLFSCNSLGITNLWWILIGLFLIRCTRGRIYLLLVRR